MIRKKFMEGKSLLLESRHQVVAFAIPCFCTTCTQKLLKIKHLCEMNYAESVLCCLKSLAAFLLKLSTLLLDFQF